MKTWVSAFLGLLFYMTMYAQGNRNLSPRSFYSPKELAEHLTAPYDKEKDKVYALFRWVTENIDYRLKPVPVKHAVLDTSTILRPLDEIVAEDVLRKGLAVCDGYTRLFKTLCTYAGIKCEIVKGYAKDGTEREGARFRTNHTWNAVFVDSAWQLLDVTWASGYVSYRGDYYVRHYEGRYFFTPPREFIQDHYPEEEKWALLPSIPTLKEFQYAPYKTQAYVRTKIKGQLPAKGIIEMQVGDTITLQVEMDDKKQKLFLSDGYGLKESSLNAINPETITQGKTKILSYMATRQQDAWLDVLHDDEVVLRYKLVVKEKSQ